jgi:hypothetical protein
MRNLIIACGLAVSVSLCASAQAQSKWIVVGHGHDKCAAWNVARMPPMSGRDAAATVGRVNWVAGYLSSEAWYRHKDMLSGVDSDDILTWLDGYCAANFDHRIQQAADAYANALIARHGAIS